MCYHLGVWQEMPNECMKEDLSMKRKMTKTMTGIMTAAMLIPTFAGVSASAAKVPAKVITADIPIAL